MAAWIGQGIGRRRQSVASQGAGRYGNRAGGRAGRRLRTDAPRVLETAKRRSGLQPVRRAVVHGRSAVERLSSNRTTPVYRVIASEAGFHSRREIRRNGQRI